MNRKITNRIVISIIVIVLLQLKASRFDFFPASDLFLATISVSQAIKDFFSLFFRVI
jgi:hypothetical protein